LKVHLKSCKAGKPLKLRVGLQPAHEDNVVKRRYLGKKPPETGDVGSSTSGAGGPKQPTSGQGRIVTGPAYDKVFNQMDQKPSSLMQAVRDRDSKGKSSKPSEQEEFKQFTEPTFRVPDARQSKIP
jgi:hypothetical protein